MRILQGIAVSPGVAVGEALVIDREGFRISRQHVSKDAVDVELQRLDEAIETAAADIERNRDTITNQIGAQYGQVFSAHVQMLRDRRLRDELEKLIREKQFSPEYAVSRTLRSYAKVLENLDNKYLSERAADIFDIERNLLGCLLGKRHEELANLTSPVIVLAHDLTPSDAACMDRRYVLGFATETGGAGSHTAIVAKALEIPAIVGTGRFMAEVGGGDVVIVDGDQGCVIIQPDEDTIARYRRGVEAHRFHVREMEQFRDLPAETLDGTPISLMANIEFPNEVVACKQRGAAGIGLYRTEFLYLTSGIEPTEQQHFEAYAEVVRAMSPNPTVIRTLDLGADKMGLTPLATHERNPFLGLRSIRISLRNVPQFRLQLRAILRASFLGNVWLMFPLISTLDDLRQAKLVLADAMEDLDEAGESFDRKVRVGMMVEVPSAVVLIDRFLREVDFVSIGTNDLIQYTLAVDRSNEDVADRYQASDPAVLRLLEITIKAAQSARISASICGQMSGTAWYTMLLLGMGFRTFSVPPSALPEIKRICRSVSIPQCESIARRVKEMESAREIDAFLREETRRVVPDFSFV